MTKQTGIPSKLWIDAFDVTGVWIAMTPKYVVAAGDIQGDGNVFGPLKSVGTTDTVVTLIQR